MSYVMLWYRKLAEGYVGTLYDYVARAYDPVLGRFISADTIVPGAGNPQAFNRYSYVRNSPLGRIDPSGHEDCSTDACWQTEWAWKNRWYEAHGWFWGGSDGHWTTRGQPRFKDLGIVTELLGEGGMRWESGDKNWEWSELTSVAAGVSDLMFRVGGGDRLARILGGVIVSLARMADGVNGCRGAAACKVSDKRVEFYDGLNTYDFTGRGGVAVHELAHIIGTVVKAGDVKTPLFSVFPHDPAQCFSTYGCDPKNHKSGNGEYFSEAVYRWLYPEAAGDPKKWALTIDQANWLAAYLR